MLASLVVLVIVLVSVLTMWFRTRILIMTELLSHGILLRFYVQHKLRGRDFSLLRRIVILELLGIGLGLLLFMWSEGWSLLCNLAMKIKEAVGSESWFGFTIQMKFHRNFEILPLRLWFDNFFISRPIFFCLNSTFTPKLHQTIQKWLYIPILHDHHIPNFL